MTDPAPPRERRRYDSSGRQARAEGNRLRILEAAHDLFLADGYTPTTIAAIAKRAEVSGPTVYAAFGTKAAILQRAIEVSLAGDDDEVALIDRPVAQWVHEADTAAELLARYAVMMADVAGRAAAIFDVLQRAADTDADLAALVAEFEEQRLQGAQWIAEGVVARTKLPKGRTQDQVRDLVWLCNAPEQWTLLVTRRGWSRDAYVAWATAALQQALDPPPKIVG